MSDLNQLVRIFPRSGGYETTSSSSAKLCIFLQVFSGVLQHDETTNSWLVNFTWNRTVCWKVVNIMMWCQHYKELSCPPWRSFRKTPLLSSYCLLPTQAKECKRWLGEGSPLSLWETVREGRSWAGREIAPSLSLLGAILAWAEPQAPGQSRGRNRKSFSRYYCH